MAEEKKSLPGAQALAVVDDAGINWGKADDSVKDGDEMKLQAATRHIR